MSENTEHWMAEPEEHDYPAAQDFLSLVMAEAEAARVVDSLRAAPLVRRKAKDLVRASGLPLLTDDNAHVAANLHKVEKGHLLSPVLLLRGDRDNGLPLVVADGYHRICASHLLDENADIPCRIADRS